MNNSFFPNNKKKEIAGVLLMREISSSSSQLYIDATEAQQIYIEHQYVADPPTNKEDWQNFRERFFPGWGIIQWMEI